MRDSETARFTALFESLSPRVYAYALRQLGDQSAQDVVADCFLVAWRRRAELPDDPLPWLMVVARNTIANRRRSDRRRGQLTDALGALERTAAPASGPEDAVVRRAALLAALADLSENEREALLLTAWDGLARADAATVAGCSVRAFEVRLSRARARLDRAMAASQHNRDTDAVECGTRRTR